MFQCHPLWREGSGFGQVRKEISEGNSGRADADRPDAGGRRYEKPVLVYDVEPMQSPQSIAKAVPSLVWVQTLDHAHDFVAGSTYVSSDGTVDVLGSVANGKRGIPIGRSSVCDDKVSSEVIQASSQVVDRIAQDCEQPRGRPLNDLQLDDVVSSIGIVVGRLAIGVTLEEKANFRIEVADVLFGPLELGSD